MSKPFRPDVIFTREQLQAGARRAADHSEKDLVTITGQLNHSRPGENPEAMHFAFEDKCISSEQPWKRSQVISEKVDLDTGWVPDPGWMVIKNTDEEQTLVVADCFEVPPGASMVAKIGAGKKVTIRPAGSNPVKIQVMVTRR